jgi:excisionase family DNA binding protein
MKSPSPIDPSPDASSAADVLTLAETAALLRISRPTLFEMLRRGEIPARKVGRQWRFNRAVVLDWLLGNVAVSRSRSST